MEALLPRLLGDEPAFLREYWRQRTHLVRGALPELAGWYGLERFLDDYRRLAPHDVTILASVDHLQRRRMRRPTNHDDVEGALASGASLVVQGLLAASLLPSLPEAWSWFVSLHDGLCDHFLPGFPRRSAPGGAIAALDIFCTTLDAGVGGHYDTGDVFYFVLEGCKEWTVELVPDAQTGHALAAQGLNYTHDRTPRHEHVQLHVNPGDCLYVPPYTYHRVRSQGPSLAVSVGLPCFTETSLMRHLLERLQQDELMYTPLPSFPLTSAGLSRSADRERHVRMAGLLGRLRGLLPVPGVMADGDEP